VADYEVVWDGRRGGPGGALLFGPENPEPKMAEPLYRKRVGVREKVLSALDMGPATARQLRSATGIAEEVIHDQMRRLRAEGIVAAGRGIFGRNVYALVQP